MSLKLGDTRVYEPQIRARLGTTALLRSGYGPTGHTGYRPTDLEMAGPEAGDDWLVVVVEMAGQRTSKSGSEEGSYLRLIDLCITQL